MELGLNGGFSSHTYEPMSFSSAQGLLFSSSYPFSTALHLKKCSTVWCIGSCIAQSDVNQFVCLGVVQTRFITTSCRWLQSVWQKCIPLMTVQTTKEPCGINLERLKIGFWLAIWTCSNLLLLHMASYASRYQFWFSLPPVRSLTPSGWEESMPLILPLTTYF